MNERKMEEKREGERERVVGPMKERQETL